MSNARSVKYNVVQLRLGLERVISESSQRMLCYVYNGELARAEREAALS